ncbi:MAG: rRNA maturation RNase YbeY [Methylotetracoccus sp.]|nr:rRNA maturation RNase YbeY [Methylotetracoccus sp.]
MIHIEVQNVSERAEVPTPADFRCWAAGAVKRASAGLVIRVVDRQEGAELNERYRGKPGPTNVLSFPFQAPPGVACDELGDVVICAPLVQHEALAQGVLHLQGFDHLNPSEAEIMEAEEAAILARLGFPNPYEEVTSR